MTIADANMEQMRQSLNQDACINEEKQKESATVDKAMLRLRYLAKKARCTPQVLIDWYRGDMDTVATMGKDELVYLVNNYLLNQSQYNNNQRATK